MVDSYNRHGFPGRSCLLELPTYEKDKLHIRGARSKVPESIDNIQQAIDILEQEGKQSSYFIAIDNVCDWNKHYVQQMLNTIITSHSHDDIIKVIVTSRSRALLEKLRTNVDIHSMGFWNIQGIPSMKKQDAFNALLKFSGCWALYNSNKKNYENDLFDLVKLCSFRHGIHPLLLKTFGTILSQVIGDGGVGWETCIRELKRFQGGGSSEFENEFEAQVLHTLKANYMYLDNSLKKLFIDIGILYGRSVSSIEAFRMLYQDEALMEIQILRLEHSGLCRAYMDKSSERIQSIDIHDLYRVLAWNEAKSDGRHLIFINGAAIVVPSSLSNVTRIISCHGDGFMMQCQQKSMNVDGHINLDGIPDFSELAFERVELVNVLYSELMQLMNLKKHVSENAAIQSTTSFFQMCCQYFPSKLNRLLICSNPQSNGVFRLNHCVWNSLCILKLSCSKIRRIHSLASTPNLLHLELTECSTLEEIKGISCLQKLEELILNNEIKCSPLEILDLSNEIKCSPLEILDLSGCSGLKSLHFVGEFNKLVSLTDLHCSSSLERLIIWGSSNLVDISDIASFGTNLRHVMFSNCNGIKEFPNVALRKLKHLMLQNCYGLEVVMPEGVFSDQTFPCLERLNLVECKRLNNIPQIQRTSGLRGVLSGANGKGVFDLQHGTLGTDIEELIITVSKKQFLQYNIKAHELLPSLINLKKLEIKLVNGGHYKHVQGMSGENELNLVPIYPDSRMVRHDYVPSMSFLSSTTSLRRLTLQGFDFIEALPELYFLKDLKQLFLIEFTCIKSLEGLSSIETLKEITLIDCWCLESLPNLSRATNLASLILGGCNMLKTLPDLSSLKTPLCLYLVDCEAVNSLPQLPASISRLKVTGCNSLKTLPQLTASISRLKVTGCDSLKTLPDLSSLQVLKLGFLKNVNVLPELPTSLTKLEIRGGVLKALTGLSYLQSLTRLVVGECESLMNLNQLILPASLTQLYVERCKSLKTLPDLHSCSQSLKSLRLYGCSSVEALPNVICLGKLTSLDLTDCKTLHILPQLPASLESLVLIGCSSLEALNHNITCLGKLRSLFLGRCEALQVLPELPASLVQLDVRGCSNLENLEGSIMNWRSASTENVSISLSLEYDPNTGKSFPVDVAILSSISTNLVQLELKGYPASSLPTWINLTELSDLDLVDCKSLRSLSALSLPPLHYLYISGCSALEEVLHINRLELWSIRLVDCKSLKHLPEFLCYRIYIKDCPHLERPFLEGKFRAIRESRCSFSMDF